MCLPDLLLAIFQC